MVPISTATETVLDVSSLKTVACITLMAAALAVTACGKSTSAQDARDAADETHALAQQANDRAEALEAEVEDLRGELQNEVSYRESEDANLAAAVEDHYHYD